MRHTLAALFLLAAAPALAEDATPETAPPVTAPFTIHHIARDIAGGYSAAVADFNGDGRPDVVALGLNADRINWYENPAWTPHLVITEPDAPKPVYLDAADIDGDGKPEILLAYHFNTDPHKDTGAIAILHEDGKGAWKVLRTIDQVPTTHRVRFADVEGNGRLAVIVAPILAGTATGFPDPDRNVTPLYVYRPDKDWKRETITLENHGVVHGLTIADWDGDGRDDIITSGYSGTYAHMLHDGHWDRVLLTKGRDAPWPGGGSGESAIGHFNGKKFFVTIEPFHGNMVVVHMPDEKDGYTRQVIDDTLKGGHALALVDVDNDGRPEIVAGGNGLTAGLFFYKANADGTVWTRHLMDSEMSPAGCLVKDMKHTGRATDVVCQDQRAPFWLTWYEYNGPG
ncbi:MAG: VCBS repeat-containing protein [Alphaproteobacteria bacterium]|nr:VCBS repeat-containing protein [Alphaproteobacteria bacterium]